MESLESQENNVQRRSAPANDAFVEVFLTYQRVADRLMLGLEEELRKERITPVQYLVLRSLRRAGSAGMPSHLIARDMTTHDPDITRLLDKLEKRNAVERMRDKADRRVQRIKLTRQGVRLLKDLTLITKDLHRKQFNNLSARNLKSLQKLLDQLMGGLIEQSIESERERE